MKIRILEVREVEVNKLKPHPYNFRVHNERQFEALDAILRDIGFVQGVICTKDYVIIDGHLRVDWCKLNDVERVLAAIVDLTEDEALEALAVFDPVKRLAETAPERSEAALEVRVRRDEDKQIENPERIGIFLCPYCGCEVEL